MKTSESFGQKSKLNLSWEWWAESMSSNNEYVNPRRMIEASEEKVLQANIMHQRSHHYCHWGAGTTVRLSAEVAQMVPNMREHCGIECSYAWAPHVGPRPARPPNIYGKVPIANGRPQGTHSWEHLSRPRESPAEREAGIDILSYMAGPPSLDPQLGDNFPLDYESQRLVRVFDRIG